MQRYIYAHPIDIATTTIIPIYDESGNVVYTFQRYYSNRLKKSLDKLMDFRYFLQYNVYDQFDQVVFTCKKVSRKGRVYYEAFDCLRKNTYIVSYDKWKELIPDLMITDGELHIHIQKEMKDWSLFIHNDKEIARWKAEVDSDFSICVEIEDQSPILDAAFFIAISQCVLFIGG